MATKHHFCHRRQSHQFWKTIYLTHYWTRPPPTTLHEQQGEGIFAVYGNTTGPTVVMHGLTIFAIPGGSQSLLNTFFDPLLTPGNTCNPSPASTKCTALHQQQCFGNCMCATYSVVAHGVDGRNNARRSGAPGPHTYGNVVRQVVNDQRTEVCGQQKQPNDTRNDQHNLGTPIAGHC